MSGFSFSLSNTSGFADRVRTMIAYASSLSPFS